MPALFRLFCRCAALILLSAPFAQADDLLSPAQAFTPRVALSSEREIRVSFTIAPGYYLYRDRFKFEFSNNALNSTLFAKVGLPAGDIKQDPSFGQVSVFHRTVEITLPLQTPLKGETLFSLTSQGCAEKIGVCFPPHTRQFKLLPTGQVMPVNAPGTQAPVEERGFKWPWLGQANTGPPGGTLNLNQHGELGYTLLAFFGAGLLMAGTVCLYPLIPIVSSLIVGSGTVSRRRGVWLAFVYVQGLALAYTLVGVIAAGAGVALNVWLQQPPILWAMVGLMVILALGMFGVFTLQMPSHLQTLLNQIANRFPGGQTGGVMAMGAFSALIVGPCATPALGAALVYISQQGNLALGAAALYAMGLGVGAPLLLVGFLGGSALPRAGQWMQTVKGIFGLLMLGVAWWLARPLLPNAVWIGAFACLLAGAAAAALWAGWRNRGWARGLGWASALGLFALAGIEGYAVQQHHPDPFSPFTAPDTRGKLQFIAIQNIDALNDSIGANKGKIILLDYYADWCIACIELERDTFSAPAVKTALQTVVLLRADVTQNRAQDRVLLAKHQLFGPPALILYGRDGRVADVLIGLQSPAQLIAALNRAAKPAL